MTALPDPHYQAEFYADTPVKRLIAWIVDAFVIFAMTFAVSLLTLGIGFFLFFGIFMVLGFAYRVITLANGSATWGMRLVAIELRTADGARFSLLPAFLHTLGYSVSIGMPLLQLVSIVLMLTTERRQGLTDMVLGTVAINRAA
ncbi:RDD family protein [Cognatishimia sp. MH4019]|uniref:RDD family protein n=1 Tax=Cognatishimia sp. MH4019 TaxID=2854030 RepID=UPI001CD4B8F6|nr:RDD family protein [Cognatishimia sp. MH4019]